MTWRISYVERVTTGHKDAYWSRRVELVVSQGIQQNWRTLYDVMMWLQANVNLPAVEELRIMRGTVG